MGGFSKLIVRSTWVLPSAQGAILGDIEAGFARVRLAALGILAAEIAWLLGRC